MLFGKEGGVKGDTCLKVVMMFALVIRTFSRMKRNRRPYPILAKPKKTKPA